MEEQITGASAVNKAEDFSFDDPQAEKDLARIRTMRKELRAKEPLQAVLGEITAFGFIGSEHEGLTTVVNDRNNLLMTILDDTVKRSGDPIHVINTLRIAQRAWVDMQQTYTDTNSWFNLNPGIKAHVASFNGWLNNLSTDTSMQVAMKTYQTVIPPK